MSTGPDRTGISELRPGIWSQISVKQCGATLCRSEQLVMAGALFAHQQHGQIAESAGAQVLTAASSLRSLGAGAAASSLQPHASVPVLMPARAIPTARPKGNRKIGSLSK